MNASKENAQKALDNLETQQPFMNEYAYQMIGDFLRAALKKLPSEKSFEKKRTGSIPGMPRRKHG